MIAPSNADAALYKVAYCAFTYYPDKHIDEPGYTLEEDLAWCLAPLAVLPAPELAEIRHTIRTLITTPTADRQPFIRRLAALSSNDAAFEGL